MAKPACFSITLITAFLFSLQGICQVADDSAFYSNAIKNVKANYFATIKEKAHLYNGIEYDYFGREAKGSPFLIDTMHSGSVFYDGILYEDVLLRYDMVNDLLLLKYLRDNNTLQLVKSKVDYFSIQQHTFINVAEDDQNKNEGSGFYELLYKHKTMLVLAKRIKKLLQTTNPEDKGGKFVQYDQYFIYRDDKFLPVNAANELVDIFKDKAGEIKKFIKTHQLNFKKQKEEAILSTTAFYNTLTK